MLVVGSSLMWGSLASSACLQEFIQLLQNDQAIDVLQDVCVLVHFELLY